MKLIDRFTGSIMGLAIGDALGAPVEFKEAGTFTKVNSFRDGGPFNLKAGEWTDDTSMALAMADSIVITKTIDPTDQLLRYWSWYQYGRYSSNGRCFDIGLATKAALERWHRTKVPYPGRGKFDSGNGSLMRLAPAVLAFSESREKALCAAVASSSTTHASPIVLDCVEIMASVLMDALDGRIEMMSGPLSYRTPEGADVGLCGIGTMRIPQMRPSGYAPESLWCALECLRTTKTFKTAVLKAVNLGGDADTIGAITGQIAGALYGIEGIPDEWRRNVALPKTLMKVGRALYEGRKDFHFTTVLRTEKSS